jgi:hypothetical protein
MEEEGERKEECVKQIRLVWFDTKGHPGQGGPVQCMYGLGPVVPVPRCRRAGTTPNESPPFSHSFPHS